ncbi:MAG: PAS domain S-box protein [Synergistales bacterium]|nr:PAS domain S-box protein [Synergistales bacterium]
MERTDGITVLLVEDEAVIAMYETRQLERYGYHVVPVVSGEEALEMVRKREDISIVLLDINLENSMDGTETARRIRRIRDLPVLFLSAHTEPEIVERTEDILSYGYVVKNSGITVLDASIKMAFKLFDARMETERERRHLSTTLDSMGDGMIATDADGLVTRMNPVAEELTGWPEAEASGRPFGEIFRIVSAATLEPADNPVPRVLEEGNVVGLANHTILIARDGREYQIADSAAPIREPRGGVAGVILVFRDVTEEYRMRERMAASEARYRNLFEQSGDGALVHDLEGNILEVNGKMCRLLGYTREELRDLHLSVLHPRGTAEFDRPLQNHIDRILSEGSDHFETQMRTKGGRIFPGEIAASVVESGQGRVVQAILRDITERKERERLLHERYGALQEAHRIARMGRWEYLHREDRLEWSPTIYEIFGIDPQRFGASYEAFLEAVHPEDRTLVDSTFSRSLREGLPYEMEHRLLLDGGCVKWVREEGYTDYDDGGSPLRTVGIVQDITVRKEAELRRDHLNEVLRAVRNVNQLITRERDPHRLIEQTCALLTETRGYRIAWIALMDSEGHCTDTAGAGMEEGFAPLDGMLRAGRWPRCVRRAIEQGTLTVTADPATECADCPLSVTLRGDACFAVPLLYEEDLYGVLSVAIPCSYAADREEQALFAEMAGDVVFALHTIESERRQRATEAALKESEARFRNYIEHAPHGIFVADSDGNYVDANPAASAITGYSREELLSMNLLDLVPPEEREEAGEHFGEVVRQGQAMGERAFITRDGRCRYWIVNAVRLADDRYIGFVVDVTRRREAEAELRTAREQLELAIDAGEYGFWDWNLDTNEAYFSPQYYTMLGYEPGAFPPCFESWRDLLHPEDREYALAQVEASLRKARPYSIEFRLRCSDGSYRWINGKGKSFELDDKGLPRRAVGVHVDIDALKRTQEELAAKQREMQQLFDALPAHIFYKDRAGRYILGNQSLARSLGTTKEGLTGGKPRDFFPPEQAEVMERNDREVINAGVAKYGFDEPYDTSGETRIARSSKIPIRDDEGRVVGLAGIVEDVTDIRRNEARINALLEEKELLLREVHHRIKNNMHTIMSLLSLQADSVGNDFARETLETARNRVRTMMLLYEKLYRSERMSDQVALEDYLPPLVAEIIGSFHNPVEVETDIGAITVPVRTASNLGLIVNELITNAMKYAFADEGSGLPRVTAEEREGTVRLAVGDDGEGFDITATPEGFGLQLVGVLTAQLDGHFSMRTENGTVCTVEFPLPE